MEAAAAAAPLNANGWVAVRGSATVDAAAPRRAGKRHSGGTGRTLAIGSSEHRQGVLQQHIAAAAILVAKPAWWQAEFKSRFTGRQ